MRHLLLAMMTLTSISAHAIELDSIKFDDRVTVAGKELVANGVGIRKATFLRIKVYYGALYLTQKSSNAGSFLGTADPKQITMEFVRDVDLKDMKKAYREAFEKANKDTFQAMLPTFEVLNNNFSDVKKGDRMIFTFLSDGVVLTLAGKTFPKTGDANFSKAVLNMWFVNPVDENLSEGLLGK